MENGKYHVFDTIIEGVQIINSSWQYIYVNDTVALQSKSKKEALLGSTMMERFPGIETTQMFKHLCECMKNGIASQMINEFNFPNGDKGYFELRMQRIPEGVLILSFDVTEKKEMELELEEKLRERTFMLQQLSEQKKQLEEFCQIIAHNLRAPLANLILISNLLNETTNTQEKLLYIEKQKPVIDFLNEIFEELVNATQVKMDFDIKKENLKLEESLKKNIDLLYCNILESKANITYDFSEAGTIYYPKIYMDSIVFNLLSNAIKYSSPDKTPEIHIKTYKNKDSIFLEIKDNGLGIDLNKHGGNLFKLRKTFHKHPNSKGYGLFITKTQVEAMGGKIQVQSIPGKGSTFTVQFKNT